MDLPSYFDDFRINTQPDKRQKKVMSDEHIALRKRLDQAPELKKLLISTFIQGSQRRATSLIGSTEHPCDVDVVAVTRLPRSKFTAAHAHQLFQPLLERHYSGRYTAHDRSWCIKVDDEVTIDLVPTSEPESPELAVAIGAAKALHEWVPNLDLTESYVDERSLADWDKSAPLWIPDRTLKEWERTHPLYLIAWTARKNAACNGHYIHVVRAVKWWKRTMEPVPKYPKGYPLEHLVAECCPDGISSAAEGLTRTLEEIALRYRDHARRHETPFLQARGIPEPQNVMRRVEGKDFAGFHANVIQAAILARQALDSSDVQTSAQLWRKLLGDRFPPPPAPSPTAAGFTPRSQPTRLSEGRYG